MDEFNKQQTSSNGVYIQDVNGKLWKTEDWDNSTKPNAIAVISNEAKFLIALTEPTSCMRISSGCIDPFEEYMACAMHSAIALSDYDGAGNTANIIKMLPSTDYAAGYCNAFTFPDGKTKGFLPSLGQLNLAYQNKEAINAALSKCGGATISHEYFYWPSMFCEANDNNKKRSFWAQYWNIVCTHQSNGETDERKFVRPFADVS